MTSEKARDDLILAVETYRAMVFRVAYGYTGSFEDSDDICQDVFLKLFQSGKNFKEEEHKKAWIIRVAINASKSLLRSSWRQKRDNRVPEDRPYYDDVADRELFDCVMRLPDKYRTVVYLYYYEDYSAEETAKIMGISQSAATTRLSRARDMLKKVYKEDINYEKQYQENV
jgi:RNA polymerase sigma-70 factor (ECF subfamily)